MRELVDDKNNRSKYFHQKSYWSGYCQRHGIGFDGCHGFGVTSPKISIRNVRIPVAIPAPVFPKRWMARDVEMEDAERFNNIVSDQNGR
mgnify:CR=1 FL=1